MRRLIWIMFAAIALVAGGSIAVILWLTRPEGTPSPTVALAVPEPPRESELLAPPPPAPPPGVTVEIEEGVSGVVPAEPLPPRVTPPPLDPARTTEALSSRVGARCGRLTVRYAGGDASAAAAGDEALLVVKLETLAGEVRVVDSVVHSPGRTRPALVSCAQWALRGAKLPAPGVAPGKTMEALLLIGGGTPPQPEPEDEEDE
jgi:hypothetical protein